MPPSRRGSHFASARREELFLPRQPIVVIGASAGGVEALITLTAALPADFPAAVFAVMHLAPESPSLLPQILRRRTLLQVKSATTTEKYEPGVIYVAPPDTHIVLEDGMVKTSRGPRENRHRPAVDVLFRSAAVARGRDVIGVVLTGTLDDGTAGLRAVKRRGGIAIVQDPADAEYPGMPQNAIDHVKVDYKVRLDDLAPLLMKLVTAHDARLAAVSTHDSLEEEVEMAQLDPDKIHSHDHPGQPSSFSCPDCGGVLWELNEGELTRYRCRVGHAFSPESLGEAQSAAIEDALWTALKTLEETAEMSHRLANAERERGHDWMVKRFEEREREVRQRAETIRSALATMSPESRAEDSTPQA